MYENISDTAITIVYMGDSITEGQYVHHSLRWTEIVSNKIRILSSNMLNTDQLFFFNRGISGETTRQGLERFPRDVQVLAPLIMTLQFGLNDCNCWDTDRGLPRVSEAAYRANLVEMIKRARLFGAAHIILATNHPTMRFHPLVSGKSLEHGRKIYNKIVRDVADECSVILCDIDLAFSRLSTSELSGMLLPEPDLLHLSAKGHQMYAAVILEPIMQAISQINKGFKNV